MQIIYIPCFYICIMGLREWLLPKDKIFFELLGKESEKVLVAIQLVDSFINQPTDAK